jgi:pimeloyl-ACP methyl ester carboxylesterase
MRTRGALTPRLRAGYHFRTPPGPATEIGLRDLTGGALPFITLPESPLLPGAHDVSIHYREYGQGTPLLFLHGGWGYEVYPFDKQIESLADRFRILIPDRSGYGRSNRISSLPADFHLRAALETRGFLDALQIDRAVLWGHSDGAVIATFIGLDAPARCEGIIFEAFHYYRVKEGSRAFFGAMAQDPESLGERVTTALAREHGDDYWKEIILLNGEAWLRINAESRHPKADLYGGRLSELTPPAIFIHGGRDPRTEPDELEAIRRELPSIPIHIIEVGSHSPHSQGAASAECTSIAERFLGELLQS